MDNLAREAMIAKQAKMSYGKWKATQEPVKVIEKPIPEGWKLCEYCGKPFKCSQGKRFCELDCRERAYEQRRKIKNAKYYQEKKVGLRGKAKNDRHEQALCSQ